MGTPDPSRKASRAFPDPPAGFDDPLEMLFGCHRRIEKQLETLKRLRAHLKAKGIDAEASTAAEAVLRYFAWRLNQDQAVALGTGPQQE